MAKAPSELKPWETRPLPRAGDANADKTFASVGRALSQWSQFESHLSILFVAFAAHKGASPVGRRAFGVVRTFEGRLEMLRAAADVYFAYAPDDAKQKDFKRAAGTEWREFSSRRNEIAHGIVQPNPEGIPGVPIKGFALVPSYYDASKRSVGWGADFLYSSVEISYYTCEFERLAKDVMPFVTYVFNRPKPF